MTRYAGNALDGDALWIDISTSQNTSTNQSTVSWAIGWSFRAPSPTDRDIRNGSLTIDGAVRWSNSGQVHSNAANYTDHDITFASGSFTTDHAADGTKTLSFSGFAYPYFSNAFNTASSLSVSIPLPTIPRASQPTLSTSSIDAGSAVTITTNRASSSFTHTLKYTFGSSTGTIATGVGASQSWTPPTSLLAEIPNSTQGTVTITCETYNGASLIGTKTVALTLKAGSAVIPSIGSISHSENVADVATAIGAYVQGKSKLNLAIVGASGVYGSTISAYKIEVDGSTINAASGVSGALPTSGSRTITATVTDSRGRTATATTAVTVLAYAAPLIDAATFSVRRSNAAGTPNADGDRLRIDLTASTTSLTVGTQKNNLRYRILSRASGASTWTEKVNTLNGSLTLSGAYVISTYAVSASWEVRVEIIDALSMSAIERTVTTAAVAAHWKRTGGMGVGKFHENGTLDVAGDIYADGVVTPGTITHRAGAVVEPSGIISAFAGSTAPTGWLLCQGQAVSRTTYAALFAVIGTTYGAGDGSTTFNLPNLKGRTVVGVDAGQTEFTPLAKTGGEKATDLEASGVFAKLAFSVGQARWNLLRVTGKPAWPIELGMTGSTPSTPGGTETGGTAVSGTISNLSPYLALNYIIKA